MSNSTDTLSISAGGEGLSALLSRAGGIDPQSLVRLRRHDEGTVEAFVTTPFEVVAARRVAGRVSRDGAVASAAKLAQTLREVTFEQPVTVDLGVSLDAGWPGALPPAHGFQLVDVLPVTVVRELADQGQALARQFSGPAGPPSSLLKQTVLTVENDSSGESAGSRLRVEIPMRMIFACTNLGLIPGFGASMDVPRHLRVAVLGRWVRIDAPFGTVYHSTRLSLF